MPLYKYTARDKQGNIKQGEISLGSERKLARWLYAQGYLLTKFEEEGDKAGESILEKIRFRLGHISLIDKVLFTRYLEVMLKSGLSLVKSLHILAEQTENRKLKKVIKALYRDLEAGSSLHQAMAKHDTVFSDLYVSVIKTGEASGSLDRSLDQLATQIKKDRDLVKKVTGAMIYPIIVFLAMGALGFVMMTFVLPKLTSVFEEFNTTLPLPTRILIVVSGFMAQYSLWIIIALAILIFFLARFIRSGPGRKIFHQIYLMIPAISGIVKKFNIARFVGNLGSLLSSGLPILKALDIVADALGNVYYKKAVKASIENVGKGMSLGKTLAQNPRLFPPVVTQVIQVGEETGSLDNILGRLSTFYEEDVDQSMKNISTIVEPVLMLVMGGAVGAMAVAIIMPIYSLTGSM